MNGTVPGGGRGRLRLHIDGRLVDEQWVYFWQAPDAANAIGREHQQRALAAETATGAKWLCEIWIPSMPEETAYLRFGTDTDGMIQPTHKTPEEAAAYLAQRAYLARLKERHQ